MFCSISTLFGWDFSFYIEQLFFFHVFHLAQLHCSGLNLKLSLVLWTGTGNNEDTINTQALHKYMSHQKIGICVSVGIETTTLLSQSALRPLFYYIYIPPNNIFLMYIIMKVYNHTLFAYLSVESGGSLGYKFDFTVKPGTYHGFCKN